MPDSLALIVGQIDQRMVNMQSQLSLQDQRQEERLNALDKQQDERFAKLESRLDRIEAQINLWKGALLVVGGILGSAITLALGFVSKYLS